MFIYVSGSEYLAIKTIFQLKEELARSNFKYTFNILNDTQWQPVYIFIGDLHY